MFAPGVDRLLNPPAARGPDRTRDRESSRRNQLKPLQKIGLPLTLMTNLEPMESGRGVEFDGAQANALSTLVQISPVSRPQGAIQQVHAGAP